MALDRKLMTASFAFWLYITYPLRKNNFTSLAWFFAAHGETMQQ
jgi:hypothetical protein